MLSWNGFQKANLMHRQTSSRKVAGYVSSLVVAQAPVIEEVSYMKGAV